MLLMSKVVLDVDFSSVTFWRMSVCADAHQIKKKKKIKQKNKLKAK